jgi:hypothetical protein
MVIILFYCLLSTTVLNASNYEDFNLENLEKYISHNDELFRVIFPEEAFNNSDKKIGDNIENFALYLKKMSPIRSYEESFKKCFLYIKTLSIRPLEILWLKAHRELHILILDRAIRTINFKNLSSTKDELIGDYINFFFAPVASLSTLNGLSPFDAEHYKSSASRCPLWLLSHLKAAENNNIELFDYYYEVLNSLGLELKKYNNFDFIKKYSTITLIEYGYAYSLAALAKALLRPAAEKYNIHETRRDELTKLIADKVKKILSKLYESSYEEKNSAHEKLYINRDFAYDLLIWNSTDIISEVITKRNSRENIIIKKVVHDKNYIINKQKLQEIIENCLKVGEYSFGKPPLWEAKAHDQQF